MNASFPLYNTRKLLQLFLFFYYCSFTAYTQENKKNLPAWTKTIEVIAQHISFFNSKEYENTERISAKKITAYRFENEHLTVSIWKRATKQKKQYKAALNCLTSAKLSCNDHCSLILKFEETGVPEIADNDHTIILSNCEVSNIIDSSTSICLRTTWKEDDLFLKKTLEALNRLADLNNK